MKKIPQEEVVRRLRAENRWWEAGSIGPGLSALKRRAYFDLLFPIMNLKVRRAVLLMGPRRVGKTVLIHHVIQQLILDGVPPTAICYISVDHPLYNDCSLSELLDRFQEATGTKIDDDRAYVFFDEIQYLRGWEVHLKSLVDGHPRLRILASGSAAAALRLKSTESGAGRFTDFLLPPLTFYEYLVLLGKSHLVDETTHPDTKSVFSTRDINALNDAFVHYLNFGGYPEVIFSEAIQSDLSRFIKSDIIDKVLLRDLPSLYGIQDIQELNALFTSLAFNTANEVSLEQLSKSSGAAKNTIKRYLEYLEAAFLIRSVHRVDRVGKNFRRANFFKVYLTNPSIRSALFAPLGPDDPAMGDLAETGVFSQWFHGASQVQNVRYARWNSGEVDLVGVNHSTMKPTWAVEVKWSDRYVERPEELRSVIAFCNANKIHSARITSRTKHANMIIEGVTLRFQPTSLYCYVVGLNIIRGKSKSSALSEPASEPPRLPGL
jgi:hypothetical protein